MRESHVSREIMSHKTVTPVTTYGAESWTLNKDIAKELANFERKLLRRMFGGIKVIENRRKRYNRELTQLFAD